MEDSLNGISIAGFPIAVTIRSLDQIKRITQISRMRVLPSGILSFEGSGWKTEPL